MQQCDVTALDVGKYQTARLRVGRSECCGILLHMSVRVKVTHAYALLPNTNQTFPQ